MAHRVRLARLPLAVVPQTDVLPEPLVGDRRACAPEVRRARSGKRRREHHAALLAALDLPERVAAELEVVALLVDRVAAAAVDQHAVIDRRRSRRPAWSRALPGFSHTLGMRWNGTRGPAVGVAQPCDSFSPIEVRLLARRLVVDEDAVVDERATRAP